MTGSPLPLVSQTPPKPVQTEEMLFGPKTEFPVALSKTRYPSFTICTYWVGPWADADPPDNRPNPNSARTAPIKQRIKPTRKRGLKKADSAADFLFISECCRRRGDET